LAASFIPDHSRPYRASASVLNFFENEQNGTVDEVVKFYSATHHRATIAILSVEECCAPAEEPSNLRSGSVTLYSAFMCWLIFNELFVLTILLRRTLRPLVEEEDKSQKAEVGSVERKAAALQM
jgi:hypothetical protein